RTVIACTAWLSTEVRGCRASDARELSRSCQDDLRVVEISIEWDLRQSLESLDVARTCAGDHLIRQFGPRWGLVPAERLAVVAHELLVERRLRPARLVVGSRPEARGVGREGLVCEHEPAVAVDPELERRVGDDDPAGEGVFRRLPVE